ncbi:ATP-dependent zinc protease [Legionella yabuuchiae]|uniref:ATP-dependent zinc protease family protein n=1 Tax=Legionella yabuuchiae TaxID=376727 RepID=UPI0010546A15|nr:RimK/LysX family protein [Legionella yabuuchiae]
MRLLFFFLFNLLTFGSAMADNDKIVYGYVEKAVLVDQNLLISTKLDTGAKSASLNAINIREITQDDKTYLNFIVPTKEGDLEFTAEYVGNVKIKVRTGEKQANPLLRSTHKRPLVLMKIRLGEKERLIRVNLANRKNFIYPLLLGREAIVAFDGIVDPSKTYTVKTKAAAEKNNV